MADTPRSLIPGELAPRHIIWRRQYDHRRYARHLSQPELNRRIRHVLLNLLRLTREGKIGVLEMTPETDIWAQKWTHVLEEMQLRFGPYPAGFSKDILHEEPFPDFASKLAAKAAAKLSTLNLKAGDVFIKYGKRKHMESLYEQGALRIQAASFFAKPDLNGAIKDDELQLDISYALSRDDVVHIVRNPQEVPKDIPDQRIDFRLRAPSDFWLYCVTNSVEPRLFVDFDADSCVVIRDKQKFIQQLIDGSVNALPQAALRHAPATYIDPLLPFKVAELSIPFAKHFGYTYQREYRFCWLPRAPAPKLDHADIQIGSLKNIAELIEL